ncbi:MAG: hypothetical protein RL308_469 [Bacteroidota bacterium]|jgi:hypothetical protein
MEDKDKVLDEIFSNDPLGLLNVKPKSSNVKTTDERLSNSFEEINDFISKNEREPAPNPSNISEYQLYSRLKSLREDEDKMLALEPQDTYGLLKVEKKEINSIDDIFNDDILGMFDDGEAQSLFEFKHTPREIARTEADFVARRKPCKNFKEYEEKFKSVQADLASGKRKLVEFKIGNLRQGAYYVHNGVLFLLEKIDISKKEHYREDGTRVREDGRTRCVFENGTESNMLKRSVEKILYSNGSAVTINADDEVEEIMEKLNNITEEDKEAGFIYVLSSKSTDTKISEIRNLYKIGYSTTPVSNRIKNAEKEPTYLMAPVHIVAEYKTFNMNTQKFEQLLHNFFGSSCLNIDIYDEKLRRHMPQEWFIAPLNVIDSAIEMIITEEIIHYKYDNELEVIILRD